MRTYGRLIKNIAGLLLLLALLSLLLPFCKFNAGDGDMTLSGIEVVKTGGKAGYTYFKEGGLSDDFVLKAPYTWGNVKDSVSYINKAGGAKILVFCGGLIAIPIMLCFLSMIMLFMAEGKKTMFLPTLFTFIVSAEMLLVVLFFSQLRPFLMIGVYLFTLLNVIALILIMAGWVTGGYRQYVRRHIMRGSDSDGDNDDSNRKKTRHKTKTKKKTKKEKSSDKNKKGKDTKKNEQQSKGSAKVVGRISDGSGIYKEFACNFKEENKTAITIGTTSEAVEALKTKNVGGMNVIAENNCTITFDAVAKKYDIVSHSKADILILQKGKVVKWLKNGESYSVTNKVVMQIDGKNDSIKLE